MKNRSQKRQDRNLAAFEEIYQAVIAMRDESEIGAEIIAQSEVAQRIINRDWDMAKLRRRDLSVLQGVIFGLRADIADAKHDQHEKNRERFQKLYEILWSRYGDPAHWRLFYDSEGAVFQHRSTTLHFGYDKHSYLICVTVMKVLSEHRKEFEDALCAKTKNSP